MMRTSLVGLFFLLLVSFGSYAQQSGSSSIQYSAEVGAMASSARRTPFWLRANQFGTVPLVAPAGTIKLGTSALFRRDTSGRGWFLGYRAEVVANAGPRNQLLLPEAYANIGYRSVELVVGRRKEVLGLVDTTLSSGSYAWSGNAIPIPKIQIGTRGFVPLHFTRDLIAINAFFAHGWFANTDSIRNSYLHQKGVYGRIGKPHWKIKFYGGILHNVQWGGESAYLGTGHSTSGRLPSSFNDYLHIIVAKQPASTDNISNHDLVNQFGNHVGSIDMGAEIAFSHWDALAYYQHPFEDKSGVALVNLPDGLYGLKLKRRATESSPFFQLNQVLFEYLTTMSQSGSTLDIGSRLYEGIDDYFNNFQYLNGWTYQNQILGTPFISRRQDVKTDWQNRPGTHTLAIVNNRVQLLHLGLAGVFSSGVQIQSKLSLSRNYGIFRSPFGQTVRQFSGSVWLTWPLTWLGGSELQTAIALDQGRLYTNSVGGWISLRKTWNKR
ncbi:capsule assembly Wzi family protein [Larkinella sp. VNQ87]|uniref:capsule assembly Wzi family protein n=1 Tax=Larkinella sp. VNQ87 TaxID=3400921 RepID=UPI003C075AC1